jgi:hypothetical protein
MANLDIVVKFLRAWQKHVRNDRNVGFEGSDYNEFIVSYCRSVGMTTDTLWDALDSVLAFYSSAILAGIMEIPGMQRTLLVALSIENDIKVLNNLDAATVMPPPAKYAITYRYAWANILASQGRTAEQHEEE